MSDMRNDRRDAAPPGRRALAGWMVVLVLGAASCGDEATPEPTEGSTERSCRNGQDEDSDRLTDCRDPDCSVYAFCAVPNPDAGVGDSGDRDGGDGGVDADVADAADGTLDETEEEDAGDARDDADGSGADGSGAGADGVDGDTPDDDGPDGEADGGDAGDDTAPDVDPTGAPKRSCATRFEHVAPGAARVELAGPFTGWGDAPRVMTSAGGGRFTLDVDLPPGEHAFKYIVDGRWDFDGLTEIPSPAAFYTQWQGGSENRNMIVGDCNVPSMRTLSASGGTDGVQATVQVYRAADGVAIDPDTIEVTVGSHSVDATFDAETGRLEVEVSGLPQGKHSVRIVARDARGREIEEAPHFIPLWVEPAPFAWQDATMYFVFTDRFRDSDRGAASPIATPIAGVAEIANYQGGDFKGVIDAIEEGYFDRMGVNLLWLSPVQENPEGQWIATDRFNQFSGFHGYWPTHARQIEHRWGDVDGDAADRLKELIAAAHARRIRVMFDIPLNHVHQDHEYKRDHPSWFTAAPCPCNNDASSTCGWDNPVGQLMCWFIDYLPDVDYRNHAIVEQAAADVEWLVTEFDVDSFRIDAAKHMHHVIMRRIAMRLDERFVAGGGAPFYLVGETFTGESGHGLIMNYVNDTELDGQYDFPLLYPIRDAFARNGSFRNLAARRRISEEQYGRYYPWMSPFLGNHDIPRFAAVVFGEPGAWEGRADPMDAGLNDGTWNLVNRMSQGFLYVLTQPGIPLIYYGDEIGLFGGGDPDNRRMMKWSGLSDAQETLRDRVAAIGAARQRHIALRRGAYRELWVDDSFYVYARVTPSGDVAIVAMNKGGAGSRNVPIPAELGIDGVRFVDTLGGPRSVRPSVGNATFTLNSWEYAILVPE